MLKTVVMLHNSLSLELQFTVYSLAKLQRGKTSGEQWLSQYNLDTHATVVFI